MNLFSEQIEHDLPQAGDPAGSLEILRCARCGRDLVAEVVLAGDAACPYCGNLFRQPAYRRIEAIVDSGSFIEIERETEAGDPLSFPGYRTKLEKERVKSKMQEGVVIGKATIKGQRTALAVMDSYFMMGSMGTVVGEKIVILAEFALTNRLPLVIFCASGGARMQEGVLSLMQMSRTTIALGEYTALAASGVLEDAAGASLVRRRGAVMDGAVPSGTGGMLSVVGLTLEQAEAAIAPFTNVFVANHLSETQLTLGGLLGELGEAKAALEAAGARMAVMLAMKGPSHCPLLNAAAERFFVELAGETFGEPDGIVYSNALGAPYPKNADYRALLCAQMNTRVRWHDCVEHMLSHGVTRFVEIGPGGVLGRMLKRRVSREIALFSVQDEASFEAFLRAEKEGGA